MAYNACNDHFFKFSSGQIFEIVADLDIVVVGAVIMCVILLNKTCSAVRLSVIVALYLCC